MPTVILGSQQNVCIVRYGQAKQAEVLDYSIDRMVSAEKRGEALNAASIVCSTLAECVGLLR